MADSKLDTIIKSCSDCGAKPVDKWDEENNFTNTENYKFLCRKCREVLIKSTITL